MHGASREKAGFGVGSRPEMENRHRRVILLAGVTWNTHLNVPVHRIFHTRK
jgi:hypothetical protein